MSIERRSQFEHLSEEETDEPVSMDDLKRAKTEHEAKKDEGYDDDGFSKPSSDDEGYYRFETSDIEN